MSRSSWHLKWRSSVASFVSVGSVASAKRSIETRRTAIRTAEQDADAIGERFEQLPQRVQETLGELAGASTEGVLALSVGVGLGVLGELMAEEVDEVVGPGGQSHADRAAVRLGTEAGSVTLGGRRVGSIARGCGPWTAAVR